MLKAEVKGERTLRSASPHRSAYKSDFHAIKCSFDGIKTEKVPRSGGPPLRPSANGGTTDLPRGRASYGNRVHKIKHLFMQMSSSPAEGSEAKPCKAEQPPTPPAQEPEPRGPEEADLDKAALAEKFTETRRLFERSSSRQRSLSDGKSPDPSPTAAGSAFPRLAGESGAQPEAARPNAGPISRRLESFLGDSDTEETRDPAGRTSLSAEDTSPRQPHAAPDKEVGSTRDSAAPPRTSSTPQPQVAVVRAEMVVLLNETSDSEEGEQNLHNEVFDQLPATRESPRATDEHDPRNLRPAAATEQSPAKGRGEESEEESEQEEQTGHYSPYSAAACGIENAAFEDKDPDPEHQAAERKEGTGTEETYTHGRDAYEEVPGLSEEEADEPEHQRKVKFSTGPIKKIQEHWLEIKDNCIDSQEKKYKNRNRIRHKNATKVPHPFRRKQQ